MKIALRIAIFTYLAMTIFYVSWRNYFDFGTRPQEWAFLFGPISWLCCTRDHVLYSDLERNFLIATAIFWTILIGAYLAWKRNRTGGAILLLICVIFWLWNGMVVSAGSV